MQLASDPIFPVDRRCPNYQELEISSCENKHFVSTRLNLLKRTAFETVFFDSTQKVSIYIYVHIYRVCIYIYTRISMIYKHCCNPFHPFCQTFRPAPSDFGKQRGLDLCSQHCYTDRVEVWPGPGKGSDTQQSNSSCYFSRGLQGYLATTYYLVDGMYVLGMSTTYNL